jgi:hypothetical protein
MSSIVYYHGTDPRFLYSIATQGFKLGEWANGRVHGDGVYVATKPETAAYWAHAGYVHRHHYAVQVTLKPGIRILWKEMPYNAKIIRSLEREFGKKISKDYAFWKHIPSNKKLKGKELIALVSHLNWMAVSKKWGRRRYTFEDVKNRHMSRFSKMIRQYGYDALGDKTDDCWDDDEILIYNPSMVNIKSIHRIDITWDNNGDPAEVVYSLPLSLDKIKKISDDEEAEWQRWCAEYDARQAEDE